MHVLFIILLVLVFIVVAIAKFKIHPFLILLLAAVLVGFFMGLEDQFILKTISQGFGNTLSSIGIIIAFGAMIGTYLEKSGGTKKIATTLLRIVGQKKSPLAMNMTGMIVSIPVFCDSAFIILSSLNKALSKKTGISLVVFSVALSTGLYVSHVFIPPTPGPLAAAAALEADLGLVILLGSILAIPTALVGYFWALSCNTPLPTTEEITPDITAEPTEKIPSLLAVVAPILIPILLIALKSIASYPTAPFGTGTLVDVLAFIGHPIPALFIGILFAVALVYKTTKGQERLTWISSSLQDAGVIILITGAGGALGNILRAAELGNLIETHFSEIQLGLFLPFILAAILKTAQGSSTVAIITTATIIAPLTPSLGLDTEISKALAVLAIGAGSMTVSHINDSYFWVVSQFSGMTTKTTLKSHTLATFFQGIVAIVLLYILQLVFT
jgi:GntP family gluconate:H+ symporter